MTGRFPSPIVAYFVSLAVIGLSTFPAPAAVPPAQGPVVPALAAFDKVMQGFMDENDISAGQLAIMRNGVVVFERSYGWQDKERMKPLPVGAPMRVGSVSKPITAAAIRALIRQKKLTLKTRVFSLRKGDGGILNFKPYPKRAKPDRYLKDITIGHLLRHRGGWDRKTVGDLTYRELMIARAMKIASPPGPINTVRYIMGKSLQHRPGSQYAYSNVGYLVLGLVIKKVLADEKGVRSRRSVTTTTSGSFARALRCRPA
jgi:N-acyl-D-amino-acid deacylase